MRRYAQRFDTTIGKFQLQEHEVKLSYQPNRISDQLVQHHIDRLLREAITHPFDTQRISAIEELGKYGRSSFEVGVLTRLSQNDPNLALRAAAIKAIDQIRTRLD